MPKSILDIKNSIDCHLGNRIVLKDKHNFERVSYTYTDVLTENVQVSFEEDNHQEAVAH